MKDSIARPARRGIRFAGLRDRETLIGGILLAAVLIAGLVTAGDYGITTDEFIFDPAGPKALAWYASGFSDRALFDYYDTYLYGPWFQILVAAAQSLHLADPFAVRHALTFVVGLAGLAALLPIGRIAIGPWAGLAALVLCLTTGNLYGHLFFTPNDVPFLAAMTWATLGVVVMARGPIPTWPATIATGAAIGLAVATRFGGFLAAVYLIGAMALCALAVLCSAPRRAAAQIAIALRTLAALVVAGLTAIALWPWLQAANPVARFLDAYGYFIRSYVQFPFPAWGKTISSAALPWHYIPGQLLARLPEGFVALLVIAAVFGPVALAQLIANGGAGFKQNGLGGFFLACGSGLASARGLLVVTVAALGPPLFVIARGSVIFDGLRHLLFVLPMLALLAAWALCKLLPLLMRMPVYLAGLIALYLATTVPVLIYLHPLEYVAMNAFVGGVPGASGRFDLDYWSAAATTAVRQLEARLASNPPARFADHPPRVMVCIGWREPMVGPMFHQPWIVATVPRDADFLIEPQRWPCNGAYTGIVIDTVQRFGVIFARTIETRNGPSPASGDAPR